LSDGHGMFIGFHFTSVGDCLCRILEIAGGAVQA
jgi:hypothetical protein